MSSNFFYPPDQEEIEITLLGTGGGYGEAVLIKIRENDWIIVDSCINPTSKVPLPLDYLKRIGVQPEKAVKLVICTHWHNDHILGISEIVRVCEEAKFCMPTVNDRDKFLKYINMDYKKVSRGSLGSFNEFKNCLVEIEKRTTNKIVKRLKVDMVLLSDLMTLKDGKQVPVEIFSLSPSEAVVKHFDKEISQLFSDFEINQKAIPEKSANEKSVVIYFRYGEFSAILGADLEVSSNSDEGWRDIYEHSEVPRTKSKVYKIPHHGSSNGYDEEIFEGLVEKDAILKLSPWNRSTKLPQPEMISRYQKHSHNLFITSPFLSAEKPKKRDKNATKLIKLFSRKLTEVKFEEGIIRTRQSLTGGKETKTETYGTAFQII